MLGKYESVFVQKLQIPTALFFWVRLQNQVHICNHWCCECVLLVIPKRISMKNLYVFVLAVLAFGCQKDEVIQDVKVLEGIYKTNGFLDPLCIAITNENQLPSLQISKQSDGSYDLVRTNFIPQTTTVALKGVATQETSQGFLLYYNQKQIGSYADGQWYDDKKDKEVTSKVLRVSYSDQNQGLFFYYSGVKK